jgi:hypothetical protein
LRREIEMTLITKRRAWRRNDPELVRDAKEFWRGLGVAVSE